MPFAFCVYSSYKSQAIGLNSSGAMTLNGVLLLEGSYFWYVIGRQLVINEKKELTRHFAILKKVNFVLFAIVISVIAFVPFEGTYDKIGTTFFLLMAILEHINYFEKQLMYDNKNDLNYLFKYGLKKSKLNRLINRNYRH